MTALPSPHDGSASVPAPPDLRPALRRLARAAGRYADAKRSGWRDQLEGLEEPAGLIDRSVVAGLRAWATDGNPVSAALRAAWTGADGKTKAAILAVLLLVVVLAPVLVLLVVLGLVITAWVHKARAAGAASD